MAPAVEHETSSSDAPPAPAPPQSEIPDTAAAAAWKPAWNVPSNGSTEAGAVMGAIIWPALSEATKASSKSSSSDSVKNLFDGSGHAISSHSPKSSINNPNPNPAPKHEAPARQKSVKRAGGGGGGGGDRMLPNGGPALPEIMPPPVPAQMPEIMPDKQAFPQPSPKSLSNSNSDHSGRGSGFAPQPHGGNDHHRSYSGNRRGNNSGGGSGTHYNNYGNRRDQERGGFERNHRNFIGRDIHMQRPPRGVLPFLRPPAPVAAPFIAPPLQVHPFAHPMGYPDMHPPMYYVMTRPPPEGFRGAPFVALPPPPPMFFPVVDPQQAMLLKQIDYYFSPENLCKDIYLRKNMDDQGWVSISLIAGFNRVKQLTNNIQYILDTMRLSTIVEVQGEKIRSRTDWMNWVLPPAPNHFSNSAPPSSNAEL